MGKKINKLRKNLEEMLIHTQQGLDFVRMEKKITKDKINLRESDIHEAAMQERVTILTYILIKMKNKKNE